VFLGAQLRCLASSTSSSPCQTAKNKNKSKTKRHRRMCSSTAFTAHALPGWLGPGSLRRRGAMRKASCEGEFHSAAQARAWADGDFDVDHGLGLDGVGRSAHCPLEPGSRARGQRARWGRRLACPRPTCSPRPCCLQAPPPPHFQKQTKKHDAPLPAYRSQLEAVVWTYGANRIPRE
jgi:hypothetical protein